MSRKPTRAEVEKEAERLRRIGMTEANRLDADTFPVVRWSETSKPIRAGWRAVARDVLKRVK